MFMPYRVLQEDTTYVCFFFETSRFVDYSDMLIIPSFLISSPSLKFTIFLYLSPIGHFDIADPSSMQDACHHELSKHDLCLPQVSQQLSGQSVRTVYGRSWVRFPSGTQIFSLSQARDMLNIPPFLTIELEIVKPSSK